MTAALAVVVVVFAWITALCAAGIDARVLIVPTSQQAFIDEMQRAKDTR